MDFLYYYGNHFERAYNVILDFDPDTHTQTAVEWIQKVNETATIYGWSDRQVIYITKTSWAREMVPGTQLCEL